MKTTGPPRGLWPVACVACRRTPELRNVGTDYWLHCPMLYCWRGPKRATQAEAADAWNALMNAARTGPRVLRELSDAVLVYLDAVDVRIGPDQTIPRDASSALAKLTNFLDSANDRVRHFTLNLPIDKAGKEKEIARLKRKAGPYVPE